MHSETLTQMVKAKIKHVLRTVAITHSQVIKDGKADSWKQVEIEETIKRNLF